MFYFHLFDVFFSDVSFQPEKLIDSVKKFKGYDSELKLKHKLIGHLRMDASSIEAVKQLKGLIDIFPTVPHDLIHIYPLRHHILKT